MSSPHRALYIFIPFVGDTALPFYQAVQCSTVADPQMLFHILQSTLRLRLLRQRGTVEDELCSLLKPVRPHQPKHVGELRYYHIHIYELSFREV